MTYDYDDPTTKATPNRSGPPRLSDETATREEALRDRGYDGTETYPPHLRPGAVSDDC